MANSSMNPKVDEFLCKATKWHDEFVALRAIVLNCGLTEEFKWGVPCYTFQNGNVVLIHGFKNYCALLFIKGALLPDPQGVLIQQTEHVQAARQIRFANLGEITAMEPTLKAYIYQAIEVEKAGLEVPFKKNAEFAIADEFQAKLNESPALKAAFEALTPGRQHAYLLHFSTPKQAKTRQARVDKCIPQIMNGKGLNE